MNFKEGTKVTVWFTSGNHVERTLLGSAPEGVMTEADLMYQFIPWHRINSITVTKPEIADVTTEELEASHA